MLKLIVLCSLSLFLSLSLSLSLHKVNVLLHINYLTDNSYVNIYGSQFILLVNHTFKVGIDQESLNSVDAKLMAL